MEIRTETVKFIKIEKYESRKSECGMSMVEKNAVPARTAPVFKAVGVTNRSFFYELSYKCLVQYF